jgi:hypothetical protein
MSGKSRFNKLFNLKVIIFIAMFFAFIFLRVSTWQMPDTAGEMVKDKFTASKCNLWLALCRTVAGLSALLMSL